MKMTSVARSFLIVVFLVCCTLFFSACSGATIDYSVFEEQNNTLQQENEQLKIENQQLIDDIEKLEDENNELSEENAGLADKVEEAAPWYELSELERQAEEERLAEEKARQAEEEKLAEEQAAAEKEAQEKIGYETGITFDQLARTPDTYDGEKVKFSGKVIQVIEGDYETDLRIAIGGDYDCVILVYYYASIVDSRVLEDDWITIYGVSEGLYTYESTLGGNITVPLIKVDKIDQ